MDFAFETDGALSGSPDVFAMFVDIMGFANAIDDLKSDEFGQVALALETGTRFRLSSNAKQVLDRYQAFHDFLQHHLRDWEQIEAVIEFSDSAYILSPDRNTIESLAIDMMRHLYRAGVPVRIGIGAGNFARLPFATSSHPRGRLTASAPFLGTSIVHAYYAQACTARGFRIFLHPSAIPRVKPGPWVYVDLPHTERDDRCSTECSFLHTEQEGREFSDALARMRSAVTKPKALLHYDSTEIALQRFVVALKAAERPKRLES